MGKDDNSTTGGAFSIASIDYIVSTEGKKRVGGHIFGITPGFGYADDWDSFLR